MKVIFISQYILTPSVAMAAVTLDRQEGQLEGWLTVYKSRNPFMFSKQKVRLHLVVCSNVLTVSAGLVSFLSLKYSLHLRTCLLILNSVLLYIVCHLWFLSLSPSSLIRFWKGPGVYSIPRLLKVLPLVSFKIIVKRFGFSRETKLIFWVSEKSQGYLDTQNMQTASL